MPKSNLMLEEKKGTPSTNTIASASAKGVTQNTAKQISEKAQAVADKYGTQDSRYDMGNPEFAKTVNTYRDQQKQKTIDNLINYRAKVLNSKADVDGDRFEYAGELNKQIAHLQSGDATYSDFNKARDFLADKFDNRKYDRDYTKATSLLNKSDEEIDSYIADMEARESDLSYGHYTDSLGEEGTIDEIKQVQKNIASARNIKEARKMFDAWEVNENYTPFDVLTMNKDGKTVSYDWTDYDTQSKEIDDRIAELTKQMNESDDMIEKAKIMDDIVALQDESIIVADKKNYQDKLISQMLLDSYADTDDVNTFEEVTSLLASRDDNTIQRMGKAGYSALVGAVNTSMNVFDVCKDYLSHKLGSDALNFHPEQFDVNDGENFSTQLRNYEKRLNNESLYGASSTQEAIVKVTNSTVDQLARMPLGEFGSLFTMALQTGAEAYRENLEMGYDRNTALTSAVVNGIITYNVEQIGWQGLKKALNSGAMNYSVGQYLYSLLTNPISEGLEEGVEYIADTWADKLVHPDWIDENGQINGERMAQSLVETLNTSLDGEQIWDAMFLGYLGGFALDTIVATPGFIQSRKQFNAYTQVKANIQQMIQSGMLTQDEVEYYTNTLTAYDIALNAYKGRSFTSDSIQLFSDMVPPLTSVADAEMSLMDSMKPSAEMDAMLEVDTVNKMREAVGVMQQAQQNLLDHGVKMTVTEFAKLSPGERIRVMEEGEHIQATGSSYRFLKALLDYKGANGEFNKKTGELYLNPTSDETVYVTLIHEFTHSLEGSKVYSSIRNMLIDEVGGQEAWDKMVESKRAEYYKKLFDRRSRMGDAYKDYETGDEAQNQKAYELAQFELVAERMSKGRSAEAIINKMAKYNRSAFYRMFDNIRNSITNDAKSKLETMFVNAVRENNLSRQENSQYSLMEDLPELHKDRAIEEFGITNDFAKAGYIMNDGRLLDFSGGQPTRMEDHRSISSVFDKEMENGTAYLTAFLNEGNIRILPETGGIDVSEVNEPTDFQYSKIRQFMNEDRDGWHTLDISGADGSTIASVEYPPRTSSQRIINDLKAFYKDGTIPQNNTINTGLFQYNSNEGTPQFSLASTFQAVGMEITKVGESVVAFNNGEEVKEVTMGMVFRSPMGNMLRMSMNKGFISRADVIKQVKMYTSMLNTVLRTQNPDLIWAIAGSIGYQPAPENVKFNESAPTMHSAFTSNSDTQYGTTFDVTTICTKTQQLIDVASRVMVELDRGLTEEEIINIVYDEVNKTKDDTGANQPVPCPVCYVFSRWVGSGKLLDSIAKLQDKYVNASTEELEARYNALSKQIDDMAKERGVKGTKARNIVAEQIKEEYDRLSLLKAQKSMLRQSLTEEQENRLASLERDMGILDDWAYLERVRLPSKYNKYHKYDPQKDYVPHDILFDLNKGEQFANEYPYTWAYRTTRGPSMGKAITPYTSQVLGQTIYGVAGSPNGLGKRRSEKYANGKLANAFLSAEITAQAKRKQSDAIKKAKAQNLLGGSRAQSTSDFRFEYVFDYILHFMDLQAIGSKGQTYTKVPEAVPMLASVGYEVNCSLMPFGRGVREVTEDTPNAVQLNDGRWVVLNCSTVTGMNIDDALKFSSIYDNVQPIMVGLNDDHIFACMRDDRITFIIPYHASGGTQARYETMMSELGEIIKAKDRQNYEKSQTDTPLPNATEEQVRRRELRKMILTGKISGASESDMELIRNSKYLSDLYNRFYVEGVDADCYGVKLSSSQASQIFPFEYWDKTTTFKTADENGRRFWEYCNELGMKPRFAQFGGKDGGEHGYWKMLIDRRMYNNDGTYHVQQAINMSNFNTDFLYRGKMEEGLVQPSKQYKKVAEIGGEKVVLADYIGNKVIDRINQGQYSLKSTFNSDGEELTPSQADYFKDTKVLDANGNLQVTYHGSPTKGITEFDSTKAGSNVQTDNVGIYFTNDKDFAEDFSYERIPTDSMFFDNRGEKGEVYKAYLNITNPLDLEKVTDEDIENLVDNYVNPSWNFEQRDRLVEELKHARDIGNHQLMKQYLDLNAISEDYDGVIANIENDNSKKEYIVFNSNQIKNTDNLNPTGNRDVRYSLVNDKETLDFLESQEHETVYRAMVLIDGKLYPPMATKIADEKTGEARLQEPTEIGKWYRSDERPDLIKNGKFKLQKDNKDLTDVNASYNPYWHTSLSVLNDQFTSAYKRPNLVVVKGEVPVSELTSGYQAEFAKDPVGKTEWHSGTVSAKLKAQGKNAREVILSRWFKPVAVLSDTEVAEGIRDMLKGTDVGIPFNVVTPGVRSELEKLGVPIEDSAGLSKKLSKDVRYSLEKSRLSQVDSEYDEAVKNNDMETAQRLVREQAEAYAEANGFNLYEGFHGTNAIFNEFRKDLLGSKNFFAESARLGFFMAGSENTAKSYTGLNSADVFGLNMDPNVQNKAKEFSQQYNVSELDEREAEVRQRITNDVMENDDGWAPHKQYLDEIKENIERAIAENPGDEYLRNVEEEMLNMIRKDEVNKWLIKDGGHEKVESAIVNSKEYQDLQEERNRVNQNWSDWLNDYGIREFGYTPNIKHLFAFMKNPLTHDFKNEGRDVDFSDLMRQAHEEGNDGVVFENVADGGDFDTIYAVFEPNQFKSADPVTYDDNGKVIPLSERFNPNTNDIRYSLQDKDDYGYHYGAKDFDYNFKSETLWQRPGRHSGAFGTGTYLFGNGRFGSSYMADGRNTEHKVDMSDYNLFKPKTNDEGFKLHDFFKALDDVYMSQNNMTIEEYDKKLKSIIDDLEYIGYEGAHSYTVRDLAKGEAKSIADMSAEELDDYFAELILDEDTNLTPFLKTEFHNRIAELEGTDMADYIFEKAERHGEVEAWTLQREVEDRIERAWRTPGKEDVYNAMYIAEQMPVMARVLGTSTEELQNIVNNAMESARSDSEQPDFVGGNYDSVGTRVMKALGYDGIDVRHLDRLDNGTYGSVIYDLKPETVRYSLNDKADVDNESVGLRRRTHTVINEDGTESKEPITCYVTGEMADHRKVWVEVGKGDDVQYVLVKTKSGYQFDKITSEFKIPATDMESGWDDEFKWWNEVSSESDRESIPEDVQNQLDADSLAEVDYINKDAKKMAKRQSILTKKQQESFERISNYDKDLVSTGEKATLDEVESDVKDMIKNDRIKDIKKNGFVESDAEAWEQHNKEVDEEIKNITSHTTSVEDANDNLKGIARILDEKPELKSPTAKEVWKKYRDWFVREFVDHGRAVYRLAKEVKDPLLYALYDYSQNVDNIVGRMFANKRVDLHTGEVIGKGFDEVFAPIRDSGLSREFQNYMYHKLNIDRMTLSDRFSTEFTDEDGKISFLTLPNKPVFNKVVTAKMSQEFCDRMEAEHPEFLEWAKDIYEYEDAELRMLVKSGRLSQEQMNILKQRYPHYVPISREMDMKPFVTDEQVVSSNRAIKKATGGTANINPLEYAMQKHSRDVYSTILHNDLYQRIGQYYEMPVDAEFEQDTDYKIDTMGNEVQPAQGENPPTLIYYENGERYVIEIDQDLYEALLPRNFAPDLPFVNGISNLRRNLITGWNPVFMFTNGMKDFQDAQFNTKFNPIEFNSAYVQAWNEIVNNGKLYQMYLNLGGEYNSYFRNDDGKVEGKGVPFLSKVIALNEKVEIAPRLAEFICSLKHDMSTAEAMYNASDITTNFKRGGRTAKWMNRNGFTFLNASIQGFDKQLRNITDAKDKEGWKGVAKYMAKLSIVNAIPLVILNGLVWDDDDEYAELSDYIKQNYYIIGKYGEGKFIRIPKGRIASFYQTVMENAVNNDERKSMWDNLMNDLVDDMESFMNNVAPNNPIDNNLLSPLIQAHTNTAWYGDDIVPTRLQDERPSEQYDDSTDALSRAIGQFSRKVAEQTGSSLFELSPYKINYLLDQYTGMLGDIGLPMLTPRAENRIDNQILSGFANPLLDKFTTDSTLKNQRVTDFYAMKEELNKLASSSEATEEQILASKYMNSVSGEMSQLYKDKRAIQSDTSIPNSEKFDEARNIQEQIIELAKKGLTGYDQIDIRGDNATVGDVEYKKSSGGDWAKTKTRDFSGYYSTYGLDEDKQSQFKSAMEMTSKKDENGKTVRNSEALATRKALEEMDEYENVLKYIEENGLEYKDFDLNKTVVGYDESKFNDKYNAVYETQEASNEPKSTSYTPRRNTSQNGSNDSEEDFFSTLLNIINAPVSTSRSGLSTNVAQVFKEGRQRSKSIRSNRDDLRKAIAKAKRKYNL